MAWGAVGSAGGGGGGGGNVNYQSTFVFQPGGVASQNVYTTWAALYAALNAAAPASANGTRAPTTISIDDSFVSPAVVPAGAYNVDSVHWTGVANPTSNTGGALLTFANGTTLTGGNVFWSGLLQVLSLNNATPLFTVGPGAVETNFLVSEGCSFAASAGAPFLTCTGAAFFTLGLTGVAAIGDGANAMFNANGGTVIVNALGGGDVLAQAVTKTAGTAEVFWDTTVPGAQGAGVTVSQLDGYVPTHALNWGAVPPTQANVALDELAARDAPLQFGASTSLLTAVAQNVPPGFGPTTTSADLVPGAIQVRTGSLSQLALQFTGNALNAAQTVAFEIFKNGVDTGIGFAGVATGAGTHIDSGNFAAIGFVRGDVISVQVTPSAPLTAAITDIMVGID